MIKNGSVFTVFGGEGFVGSNLVKKLARYNCKINIITSSFSQHDEAYINGFSGQICKIKFENTSEFYQEFVYKSDYIVNLIGILRETKNRTFSYSHVEIPKNIALHASRSSIKKLIHISALGIDKSYKFSSYAKTKLIGEKEVLKNYPSAVVIRPSVVFGSKDKFINNLLFLAKKLPFFPVVDKGGIYLQPIFIEDLTNVIMKILNSEDNSFYGNTYEIGGQDKLSLLQIINMLFEAIGKTPRFISINRNLMKLVSYASLVIKSFPINPEEVDLLSINNTIQKQNLIDLLDMNTTSLKYYVQKNFSTITS